MPPFRRPASSQGQPAPAGIEPGPLETAEAARGVADDELRQSMAEQAVYGRAEGHAERGPAPLSEPSLRLYQLLSGQFHHELVAAAPCGIGRTEFAFPEEIGREAIYIVRGLRVLGPAGAKLALYLNNVTPASFIEVVTNVQEYSGEPPGTQVIQGPARIIAVITEATAAGLCMVKLAGDLVTQEPIVT